MTTLDERLERIYAAISETKESDLSTFPLRVESTDTTLTVWQDFSGDLKTEQMANQVHLAIHNVAHFPGHLRKWAGRDTAKRARIDAFVSECTALLTIIDLSNNDKHGYPPRDGGRSRSSPFISDLMRVLQMSSGAEPNVAVFDSGRGLVTIGGGSAEVIVTGTIKDASGNVVGDLATVLQEAVTALERLLRDLGGTAA